MLHVLQIDQHGVDTEKAVDRISRQLLEHNIVTEGYGGEVPIIPVRATPSLKIKRRIFIYIQ